MSTYLADIMTIVGKMKPTPPNFIYEDKDWANVMIDGIHNGLPVIRFDHNVDFSIGGKHELQEEQNVFIEFMYKTDFESSQLLKNAPLVQKGKDLAIQFWMLLVNSHLFEITETETASGIMVYEKEYDNPHVGVALQFRAKKQAGTCYSAVWTGALAVTPTPISVPKGGGTYTLAVTGNTVWTVTSNKTWAVPTTISGFEEGSAPVIVAANTGSARTALITIAGTGVTSQVVTINQAAAVSIP